ncbi:hypothetical protein MJO29_012443 [Puccinia striiformis f. sp. tritici]|nr:hypothetical protein MJO29_012443 [Puccinia striiformis f. sp. tritici]
MGLDPANAVSIFKNVDALAAQNSVDPFTAGNRAGSRSVIKAGSPKERAGKQDPKLDKGGEGKNDYEQGGNIPEGLAERQGGFNPPESFPIEPHRLTNTNFLQITATLTYAAEIQSMEDGWTEIESRIDHDLETFIDSQIWKIKIPLEDLYHAIRAAAVDRVMRLNGLDLPKNFLRQLDSDRPKSSVTFAIPRAGSLELTGTSSQGGRVTGGDPQIRHDLGKTNRWTILRSAFTLRKLRSESSEPSSIGPPQISDGKSLTPDDVEISSSGPKTLEALLVRNGVRFEGLDFQGSKILDWFNFGQEKKLTNDQKTDIWESLQNKLIKFRSRHQENKPDPKEADFQLQFLEALYSLGDYILRYRLLPYKFVRHVEIFKPDNLLKMVEYNIELLFYRSGPGGTFFEDSESVVPDLEYLISALSTADQKQIVYVALSTILSHTPESFPSGGLPSPRFAEIREGISQVEFLEDAESLRTALINTIDPSEIVTEREHSSIFLLIEKLINFFQEPEITLNSDQRRIEFQLVYYTLAFLENYYPSIIEAIVKRKGQPTLFKNQLDFMTKYLRFYRNRRNQEDPKYLGANPDITFLKMATDNHFRQWMRIFTFKIFGHTSCIETEPESRHQEFNVWMGKTF